VTAISAMCQTTAEGPAGEAGELEAFAWAALSGDLPFDVQTILITPEPGEVLAARSPALHDPARNRRLDAVKLFLDGTLGGRTACMHGPFADDDAAHGMRTLDDDEAFRRMEAAHLAGLQICVHAIGDAANGAAAHLFERLLERHPGGHRHRVEHASVLDDHTVEAFSSMGLTAVVQPINLRSERHWLARRVGPERLSRTYAFRSLLDAGVPVAGSSDAPIERTDVLAAVGAAVDRRGMADDQAIDRAEALAMFTTGGSRARGTEHEIGAIRPGLRADLVVLDADPLDERVEVDGVSVLATFVGGVAHHIATPSAGRSGEPTGTEEGGPP
jgi:predicted amidohydrolase YtcJ